ncbi:MAG: indole-3-glycerol phosphate synthase TrpC [Chloroflexi bacterium HGW-Chloroflexi-3]|nr:MAG: indole-3-glycerol phosphate synthase TrpC [Chloroflexi bacterium HGW-Chloroflexi-3]
MILDAIVASTIKRVAAAQEAIPLTEMLQRAFEMPAGNFRLEAALRGPDISFICEVKKASPSKGVITEDFPYLDIAREYEAAGACAISVLTEPDFFQGSNRYLSEIRQQVKVPLLRKDFTVDEYQIYEAKVIGADAVLLICALLDTDTIRHYVEICNSLGLSALVEAHTAQEVESAVAADAKIIGVNNRNLKTFEVHLETCAALHPLLPEGVLFVAESGIQTAEDIAILRQAGVDAVLIGETLMRSNDKSATLQRLRGEGTP